MLSMHLVVYTRILIRPITTIKRYWQYLTKKNRIFPSFKMARILITFNIKKFRTETIFKTQDDDYSRVPFLKQKTRFSRVPFLKPKYLQVHNMYRVATYYVPTLVCPYVFTFLINYKDFIIQYFFFFSKCLCIQYIISLNYFLMTILKTIR